jgi:VanZ family protein
VVPPPPGLPTGARWGLAGLVLGSLAFTVLGSLVPFEFRSRGWADATGSFAWAMTHRVKVQSRSDAVANVLLGVPLGFGLLGWVSVDRGGSRRRLALWAAALWPACLAVAAAVEFAQLYLPARTCAGSDVLAQGLGALLGMAAWLAGGQRLTDEVRQAMAGSGTAVRGLIAYLLLLAFLQALPLDLSLSPADAYRKFRDGGVQLVPLGEFPRLAGPAVWHRLATLTQLAALYLPVGLLAAQVPGRFWAGENAWLVGLAAVGLALGLELAQVLVQSRSSSATDVLVGGSAVLIGWRIGRGGNRGVSWYQGTLLGLVWVAAVVLVGWHPFELGPPVPFDWLPGSPLVAGNPLWVLDELLTKLVLFGLLGVIVAAVAADQSWRVPAWAALIGLLSATVIEVGQTRLVGHTPGLTDVLLGGLGAGCGAWTTNRVKGEVR